MIEDATWFPFGIDWAQKTIEFVRPDPQKFQQAPFHDELKPLSVSATRSLKVADIDADALQTVPAHYIFHSAYCGSTLLARALHALSSVAVYREPQLLSQLAAVRGRGAVQYDRLADIVIGLLGRDPKPDTHLIIKPCSEDNILLPDLLRWHPSGHSKGLLIYADLTDHLAATLKSKGRRRGTHARCATLKKDGGWDVYLSQFDPQMLDDATASAALWVWQMAHYEASLGTLGVNRLHALPSALFFSQPAATLGAISQRWALGASAEQIAIVVDSALFQTHAKAPKPATRIARGMARAGLAGRQSPQPFTAQDRAATLQNTALRYAPEFAAAQQWVAAHFSRYAAGFRLPNEILMHAAKGAS